MNEPTDFFLGIIKDLSIFHEFKGFCVDMTSFTHLLMKLNIHHKIDHLYIKVNEKNTVEGRGD